MAELYLQYPPLGCSAVGHGGCLAGVGVPEVVVQAEERLCPILGVEALEVLKELSGLAEPDIGWAKEAEKIHALEGLIGPSVGVGLLARLGPVEQRQLGAGVEGAAGYVLEKLQRDSKETLLVVGMSHPGPQNLDELEAAAAEGAQSGRHVGEDMILPEALGHLLHGVEGPGEVVSVRGSH